MELGVLTKLVAGLVAAVFLMTVFSGCVELLGGEDPGANADDVRIAKKVVWTIDEMVDQEGSFEDMVKTRLEYTHRGASVPAGELMFTYTNEKGAHRENAASQFTGAQEVRDGDVITITGANITSGLVVRHGDETLAKRGNLDDKWFRAAEMPLPLHASEAGVAQYEIDSSAGFRFNATGIPDEGVTIHRAFADVEGRVTGPMSIKTLMPGGAPRIELSADLKADLDLFMEARVTEEGNTYEAGMEVTDFVGELEGLGTLQFSADGGWKTLEKTGESGRLFIDGKVHVWDQDHPRSANYEPEDIEHPMVSESQEYSEEPVDDQPNTLDHWVADFVSKLWSMHVAVGDDYRLHYEYDSDEGDVEFDYIIQIVGEENRDVGGQSMPAYRVSQLAKLVIDFPNGVDANFDVVRGTYWVSKDSYLPLYAQISSSRSFSRADAEQFLRAIGEDIDYELPETFVLVLSGEQILKLTSYSGDFTIAPIVGVLMGNAGSYGLFGAPSMFFMMGSIGGDDEYEYDYPEPPTMMWSAPDELGDRLTVTAVESTASWSELAARLLTYQDADVFVTPTIGGVQRERVHVEFYGSDPITWEHLPVTAGDSLHFCVEGLLANDVQIEILHEPSYMPMTEAKFSTLSVCS